MADKESIVAGSLAIFAAALIVSSAMSASSGDSRSVRPEGHQPAEAEAHYPVALLGKPAELAALKKKALLGESGAAGRLVEQYENCLARHHLKIAGGLPDAGTCEREMKSWIVIGSENGDLDMIGVRFNGYFAGESCEDAYRAKFWLDKVLRQDAQEPWPTMAKSVADRLRKCESSGESD